MTVRIHIIDQEGDEDQLVERFDSATSLSSFLAFLKTVNCSLLDYEVIS